MSVILKFLFICDTIELITLNKRGDFIWNIEITGNKEITKEEIIQVLNENGLKIGTNKNKIDTNLLINNVIYTNTNISLYFSVYHI